MNDENNKISIIVPIYKAEKYIGRCIESIIKQSHQNIEIILVNDGSPDKSGEICEFYKQKDNRIKIIHQANLGISSARNSGIDCATGDYIGLVDSDDFLHPKMYEILLSELEANDSDISICRYRMGVDDDIIEPSSKNSPITMSNIEILNELLIDPIPYIVVWNKLYKRTLFENIRYPDGKIYEDERTTYQLLYLSKKTVFIYDELYYYYQSEDSFIRSGFNDGRIQFAEAMEDRILFLHKQNLPDLFIMALKKYCIWLLSFNYMNRKELIDYSHLKKDVGERKNKHIISLLKHAKLPIYSKLTYLIALIFSYIIGFFAFHRIYRYNFITKFSSIVFDDRINKTKFS